MKQYTRKITIWVSEEELKLLNYVAKKYKRTKSSIIRDGIEKYEKEV